MATFYQRFHRISPFSDEKCPFLEHIISFLVNFNCHFRIQKSVRCAKGDSLFVPPCAGSSHGAFGAPHATRRCALRPTFVYVMAARSCRARFAASLLTVRRLGQIGRPRFEPMQDLWAVRLEALQRLCGQPKICRPVQGRQKHAASKKGGSGGAQGISRPSGPSSAPFL